MSQLQIPAMLSVLFSLDDDDNVIFRLPDTPDDVLYLLPNNHVYRKVGDGELAPDKGFFQLVRNHLMKRDNLSAKPLKG